MNRISTNKIVIIALLVILVVAVGVTILLMANQSNDTDTASMAEVVFNTRSGESLHIFCELAMTPEEKTQGLMFREQLPNNQGMLFVYNNPRPVCFWMKNTYIPLDIIFVDENKTITNIEEAAVQLNVSDDQLRRYCSPTPCAWVVEVNQGICSSHGIYSGDQVEITYN